MFSKLAFNNVRKSIKDYSIYFLTLTFGVCLFYTFNSMESQQAMLDITKSQYEIIKMLTKIMGIVSIFISVILGFLIIYANKFLIKRRKKELGIYMTLGMDKGKISQILMLETLVIGVFALGFGLILGIFASQGLSVVTARMLETSIKRFYFVFSVEAFVKSILYFGVIFVIVMIFNTISVSKYKLIDLLYGSKKNESLKMKKLWVSVLLFLVSVITLGSAYYLIIDNGMLVFDRKFAVSLVLGVIGTLTFFMSLSGFLLKMVQANKRFYFKNLNMFILRQINSKINTTYISMTLICLMLFVTIGMLSTGMGMADALTGDMEKSTPYDASFTSYDYEGDRDITSIQEQLKEDGLAYDDIIKETAEIAYYVLDDITYEDLYIGGFDKMNNKINQVLILDAPVNLVSLTDYNKVRGMQGLEPISLEDHEFAINSNFSEVKPIYDYFLKNPQTISIEGDEYQLGYDNVFDLCMETTTMLMDEGTIILPDHVLEGLSPVTRILNVNYKESNQQYEDKMTDGIEKIYQEGVNKPYNMFITRIEVFDQGAGIKTVVSYFILYIGIVFLITCAAILALQQLTESSDNIERYKLLRKIGVEEKMMNQSLVTQIFIYFMMPLSLAIVHSLVGIKVVNNLISIFGNMNVLGNIVFSAIILLVIYGGYFVATCIGSKNIIKERK